MAKLKVLNAGVLCTIQDEGRFGYRQYGIPQSGVMDLQSMLLANKLVGNQMNAPVLEIALQGLKLEAKDMVIIAVTGAAVKLRINGVETSMNKKISVKPGETIDISQAIDGVYTYLGINGQIQAQEDFESFSTYLMAGFGGLNGRALRKDDEIEIRKAEQGQIRVSTRKFQPTKPLTSIRIEKGPEWHMLKESIRNKVFRIDPSSNRMGIRLAGDPIAIEKREIVSSAVIPGTIQLPSNGLPIVLMNDCQTTGGYPRIGQVLKEDMGILAQLRPGREISFKTV